MFIESYPKFEKDMILKATMLENVKTYPREMLHLLYEDYSDGILCGVRILVENERTVVVAPGIIKRNGRLYHLSQPVKLESEPLGIEQIVTVRFLEQEETTDFITYGTQIYLKQDTRLEENEMELCHFILKEGAVLRKDYQDLRDMGTLHNTINIIEADYAGKDVPTLSPEIMYRFGSEMIGFRLSDSFDISFVLVCMQKQVIQREVIEQYIRYRVPNAERGHLTNRQMHHYLTMIVDDTKRGTRRSGLGNGAVRRMVVD